MKPLARVGLIVAGYVAAVAIASVAVAVYVKATSGPDRVSSGGMYAFGDSLLFLAVFGLAAVPATSFALYSLRHCRWFWRLFAIAASTIAVTVLAALGCWVVGRKLGPHSALILWVDASVLRLLIAPLLALAFFLSGLFAPNRSARAALLISAGAELFAFAWFAFALFLGNRGA